MNVDWIAGHHLLGNTRCRTRGCGTRSYTVTIIRMAITVAAAIHAQARQLYLYTLHTVTSHTRRAYVPYIYTACIQSEKIYPDTRKQTQVRCAGRYWIYNSIRDRAAPRSFSRLRLSRHRPPRADRTGAVRFVQHLALFSASLRK